MQMNNMKYILMIIYMFCMMSCGHMVKEKKIVNQIKDSIYVEYLYYNGDTEIKSYHKPIIRTGTINYMRLSGKRKRQRVRVTLDEYNDGHIKFSCYEITIYRPSIKEKEYLYEKRIGDKIMILQSFYPYQEYNIKIGN